MQIWYIPSGAWDPPPQMYPGDHVDTFYKFTRGGLRGIDFGGTEVRTNAY
jgi:hypothetical protein